LEAHDDIVPDISIYVNVTPVDTSSPAADSIGETVAMAPHRVGIIGLGTVGTRFVEQFSQHDSFTVSAAWDASAEARARTAPHAPVVDSPDAVIESADLVYIAVPPAAHAEYVRATIAAGRAVFCEKPLGIDVTESRALVAEVEASGLPAAVNFVFGSAPAAVELVRLAGDGSLGDLRRVELDLHFAQWPRAWQAGATWLAGRAEGGWIREVSSHFVFLAGRTVGRATPAGSIIHRAGPDLAEDLALAHLRLGPDDVPMAISGSSGGAGPDVIDFRVRGATAAVRIVDWYRLEITDDAGGWAPVAVADEPTPALAAYRAQVDGLAALLEGRPHTLPTFAEALGVQEAVEAILEG
jgi:predicted dehydrogenase